MTDSEGDARKYSFKLIGYRGRSEKELRERLSKKGFSGEVITRTMEFLTQAGYMNDAALAENLKRQAMENKLLGFEGAKVYMIKRGIPSDVVARSLDYDEDKELRNLQKLVDKKLRSMGDYLSKKEIGRLYNFLARRGYSFGIIRKALRDLKSNEEFES